MPALSLSSLVRVIEKIEKVYDAMGQLVNYDAGDRHHRPGPRGIASMALIAATPRPDQTSEAHPLEDIIVRQSVKKK